VVRRTSEAVVAISTVGRASASPIANRAMLPAQGIVRSPTFLGGRRGRPENYEKRSISQMDGGKRCDPP